MKNSSQNITIMRDKKTQINKKIIQSGNFSLLGD